MNKSQLVDALADRLGDRKTAATAVDALLQIVVDTVRSGDSVSLAGFGVFESRARAARTGRNPRTGETVAVPATTVPAFRPGTGFRSAVAGDAADTADAAAPAEVADAAAASSPLLTCGDDERFGRRCGAQRCRRPGFGAHHDAARRPARDPGRRQAGQGEEACRQEGGRQEADAKVDAKAAKSAPKADAKKGKKGKKGK